MMQLIYFLLTIITLVYFLAIPLFFHLGKISTPELITLLGVLPLALVAIFQEQFKRWFFAPKLVIDFELDSSFCSKTPFFIGWKTPQEEKIDVNTEAYGFRCGVRNTGKSQAELCEVFITDLQELRDNNWTAVEYFQQVPLTWDKGVSTDRYIHINPSPVRTLCDIGHIIKKAEGLSDELINKFHLSQLYIIGGYQPQHLEPCKKYRFKVVVASKNADVASQSYEYYWSGIWKDKSQEMFREITIVKL